MDKTIIADVPVRSLKKALDLLDLVIEADSSQHGASLAALAERMQMPANSVHNLLKTMTACGYVSKSSHGIYTLGVKCRQLGVVNRLSADRLKVALVTRLEQLADETGEACLLAVLLNGIRIVAARVDSTKAIQVALSYTENTPFFAKATGRILAAGADPEELTHILSRHGMPGAAWDGISTEADLQEALERVRRQGWCQVDAPEEGLIGLACPVMGTNGAFAAALGVYAPAFRLTADRSRKLVEQMRLFAATLPDLFPSDFATLLSKTDVVLRSAAKEDTR